MIIGRLIPTGEVYRKRFGHSEDGFQDREPQPDGESYDKKEEEAVVEAKIVE